jgi:hypothetical protein
MSAVAIERMKLKLAPEIPVIPVAIANPSTWENPSSYD